MLNASCFSCLGVSPLTLRAGTEYYKKVESEKSATCCWVIKTLSTTVCWLRGRSEGVAWDVLIVTSAGIDVVGNFV